MDNLRTNLGFICFGLVAMGAAPAWAAPFTVYTEDCRQIVTHEPADDVAYLPGVDVSGNPVVPADLGGGYGITAPEEVTIDIRLDLAERLPLGGGEGPGANAAVATIGRQSRGRTSDRTRQ